MTTTTTAAPRPTRPLPRSDREIAALPATAPMSYGEHLLWLQLRIDELTDRLADAEVTP